MSFDAVVFDFDYTLGDTTGGITASMNFALSALGYGEVSVDEVKPTIGLTLSEAFRILTGCDDSYLASMFDAFFQIYAKDALVESAVLYPHAADLLTFLHKRGIRLGVVTTKRRHHIINIMKKFGLEDVFDSVIGSDNVENKKPDPEGLLKTQENFGVEKSRMLYVGDSFVDAEAAERARIPFAAVLTGTTARERFDAYPAYAVFDDLYGLGRMLSVSAVSGEQVDNT